MDTILKSLNGVVDRNRVVDIEKRKGLNRETQKTMEAGSAAEQHVAQIKRKLISPLIPCFV